MYLKLYIFIIASLYVASKIIPKSILAIEKRAIHLNKPSNKIVKNRTHRPQKNKHSKNSRHKRKYTKMENIRSKSNKNGRVMNKMSKNTGSKKHGASVKKHRLNING